MRPVIICLIYLVINPATLTDLMKSNESVEQATFLSASNYFT